MKLAIGESAKSRRPFRLLRNRGFATVQEIRSAEHLYGSVSDLEIADIAGDLKDSALVRPNDLGTRLQYAGLVAEAVFRTYGFRLHDVQLQALAEGQAGAVLEMQTGEGKTVVTGGIAAVQSLRSESVHVSTTNDYLAARDFEAMQPVFELLGISSSLLPAESNEAASRRAYRQQIVYGPGYQFGFDYLRDQMFLRSERPNRIGRLTVGRIQGADPLKKLIQSGSFHAAIVDEADSIMIDEATTPLVISLPSTDRHDPKPYVLAKLITDSFQEPDDYSLKMPGPSIVLHDSANERGHAAIFGEQNLQLARPWRMYLKNALQAKLKLKREIDYVVVDGMAQIVDQYTGRIQPDRTWQAGLHQAVEAKEGLEIQPGRESTAQITRQRFLQMYDSLIGLTGTAAAATEEFRSVYDCSIVAIATNLPGIRQHLTTRFFTDLDSKLAAIAADTAARHRTGQPVLVGTRTIRESFEVQEALKSQGLNPVVLNGVQDEKESEIVAQAGTWGAVTIATNMAGRGTDIKPSEKALAAGGLHVVGVSPNLSHRIDRQLAGRSARQGQPGSCQFFASADDSIFKDNTAGFAKRMKKNAGRNGESADFSKQLLRLQMALEQRNRQQREGMMFRDRWMDTVRESIEKD